MRKRAAIVIVIMLCLALGVASIVQAEQHQPQQDSRYTVSVIPFYSPEKIWLLYDPLVQHLKATTGLPWQLKLYPSHDALLDALCKGELGVALLGPVPLGRAMKSCGAQPLAVALGKDGKPFYRSIVITGDPSVKAWPDLKGKSFGLFKGSTAAHILPVKMLKDAALGSKDVMFTFLESQDSIMSSLLNGNIAAAGVKESLYKRFQKEPLRVLGLSELLPNFAFAALPSWPEDARKPFTQALLKLSPASDARDAETVKPWDDEVKNGFISPDKDYAPSVRLLNNIYTEVMDAPRQ